MERTPYPPFWRLRVGSAFFAPLAFLKAMVREEQKGENEDTKRKSLEKEWDKAKVAKFSKSGQKDKIREEKETPNQPK